MKTFLSFIILFTLNFNAYAEIVKVNLGENKSSEIYYEIFGEGKPVIIFHRATSGYLEPIFEKNKDFKRIYIDPPGIGNSSADSWISNADDCLNIMLHAIDKILDDENFAIAGFSYFGYMARGVLSQRKNKVDGLLLICPVVFPESEKRNLPNKYYTFADSTFLKTLTANELEMISGFATKIKQSFEATKNLNRNDVLMNVEFWNKIKSNSYSFSFDPEKEISLFENPVLIFAGMQDNVVGFLDIQKLFPIFPTATIVIADYASHSLPYEKNDLLNFHISDWLEKLKAPTLNFK